LIEKKPVHNIKVLVFFIIIFLILFLLAFISLSFLKRRRYHKNKYKKNKLIEENFFIIDSNNLDNISSHMFGFSVTKNGILTDNYYKQLGYYEEPEPQGVFIMIRILGNQIRITQDFHGSYGIYLYENKETGYFALSNSFLLLENYLVDKENITFNKDFADNLIITLTYSSSIYETLIKEIIKIPYNAIIIINRQTRKLKFNYINYKEKSVPFESKEGLKIIDKWIDKWGYIIRSIIKKTNNIYFDLSGGFDTRTLLSIVLSSGIDINNMSVRSIEDNVHGHDEDLKIAKNISTKFGFRINHLNLDKNFTKWDYKDSIISTLYTKLGFHKEFYIKKGFFDKPRFAFSGGGGEYIRGAPNFPISKFIEALSSKGIRIKGHAKEFYNSSFKLINRSIEYMKKENICDNNEYEISSSLYSMSLKNHFGKLAVEGFIANIYFIQPLIDPDLMKIKFNLSEENSHDLISYLYVRFAHDLINFPFQGNRTLSQRSIIKAEKLNNILPTFKNKQDYSINFFLDDKKKSPVIKNKKNKNPVEYLKRLFESKEFIKIINKLYDNNVYNWAKEYSKKSDYFPLRHEYGLLAIAITLNNLELNKNYIKRLGKVADIGKKIFMKDFFIKY